MLLVELILGSYSLQGLPPFSVYYAFDGVESPAVTVYDPIVTFAASKSGVLSIARVCNSLECCTRPVDMSTRIWDMPKAFIADGENIEEDIREGDESLISVKLDGQPPFSFSWARTYGAVVETFNVEGVEEKEYLITAVQEGFYEVVRIDDRYCSYPQLKENSEADANVVL